MLDGQLVSHFQFNIKANSLHITGWGVPWIWTAVMSLITFKMVDSTCREEDALVQDAA